MLKNKKVLITCGPTWVPIDTMRVISNRSTGTLGQMIARDCAKAGAKVTLLEGPVDQRIKSKLIRVLEFSFFNEFAQLIKKELKKKYDVCIHAAAVSDYRVKKVNRVKLSSQLPSLTLNLVPTEKIVHSIKKLNPDIFLVSFKLESKMNKAAAVKTAQTLFQKGKCDLVVANSSEGQKYTSYIVDRTQTFLAQEQSRQQLSKALVNIIKGQI